jgi:hypothetical protein
MIHKPLFLIAFFALCCVCTQSVCAYEYELTASSCEDHALYGPENIFDQDHSTRWSSRFADDEWLEIDLGHVRDVAGFILYWEDAYALDYSVHVSLDRKTWQKAYETKKGDGGRDEFYFRPQQARFIRFVFFKRATGWGFSLWEIELLSPDAVPRARLGSIDIEGLFDSDPDTGWTSRIGDAASVVIDLKRARESGGLDLTLKSTSTAGIGFYCAFSLDGIDFEEITNYGQEQVFQIDRRTPVRQRIRFDPLTTRFLRLRVSGTDPDDSISLLDVTIKEAHAGVGDAYSEYEARARQFETDILPRYFTGEQRYWTVTGLPFDKEDVARAEDGSVESGFSIRPYVFVGQELFPGKKTVASHTLLNGFMPIPAIEWTHTEWIMRQELVVAGDSENAAAHVRISFKNTSPATLSGQIYLGLHPFLIHPKWLYGGLARIDSLARVDETVFINNEPRLKTDPVADGFAAASFLKGDITTELTLGATLIEGQKRVDDHTGLASGALAFSFSLSPNEEKIITYTLTLRGNAPEVPYHTAREQSALLWRDLLRPEAWKIPETDYKDALLANLAYVFVNMNGTRLQPGSRVYGKTWMRDGAISCAALLRMGYFDEVKRFLQWMAKRQKPDGRIPFTITDEGEPEYVAEWREYDSQGQFVYAVAEYYRFRKDRDFLREMAPVVERALLFLKARRAERLVPEYANARGLEKAKYGILPDSNSHEGYFPSRHSYWDDYWALRGLRDGLFIDRELGVKREEDWITAEAEALAQSVRDSIKIAMREFSITYVPGCVELGDFDPNAPAIALFPCAVADILPERGLKTSLNKYFLEVFKPRQSGTGGSAFSGYELRNAVAFVMGNEPERAHQIIQLFFGYMRPAGWRAWSETLFTNYREGGYLGDIPHSWVGSIYVTLVRSLFVYENENALILLAGVPQKWFMAREGFSVNALPTWFGNVSISAEPHAAGISLHVEGSAAPPEGFHMRIPGGLMAADFSDPRAEYSEGLLRFFSLPFHCEVQICPATDIPLKKS